jgi:hypothetical protein
MGENCAWHIKKLMDCWVINLYRNRDPVHPVIKNMKEISEEESDSDD